MPRRRISPLFAVFVAFVVLMASNAWLKSIFGYGEIATDIPFLLAGAVLFLAWRFNRRAASQHSGLPGSARRLAMPEEIMRMRPDQLLLLRQGEHPLATFAVSGVPSTLTPLSCPHGAPRGRRR